MIGKFLYNFILAIDQLINTILLGHPDETISSRLGRAKNKERYIWVKYLRIFINLIFLPIEKNHCENAIRRLEQLDFQKYDYELWNWQIDGKINKKK